MKRIVIAGASGLIGSELTERLRARGDEVVRLVRGNATGPGEATWSPARGELDPAVLERADAVVSLSGASVGKLPWSKRYRRELWNSRIDSTRTIVDALERVEGPKPALLSGSASGFYGSPGGGECTESAPAGDTFLARLCAAWEAEAMRAASFTRVATLRTSPVLHPLGVLKPMVLLTKLGLGGPLGSGRQVWPWISLNDEVGAITHIIDRGIEGPVNLAGPTPATNAEIGRALARSLGRPFWLPAPEFALRLALGRDATESLLTADATVVPEVLIASGYEFTHCTPEAAIEAVLG